MSTTKASRALVAYFDHKLAYRLTRHVLKSASPAATKTLADAVLALIPKACEEAVWATVLKFVDAAGVAFVATDGFKAKVDKFVAGSAESWIEEAAERVIVERVRRHADGAIKNDYASSQAVKAAPAKFQGLLDAELARLAREKAQQASAAAAGPDTREKA